MNKDTNEKILNYLSLILVLSFFIIKNILFVLIGISIALLSINKKKLHGFIQTLSIYINTKNELKTSDSKPVPSKDIVIAKNDSLTLVEAIEEYGFIPSQENNNKNNAAWFLNKYKKL